MANFWDSANLVFFYVSRFVIFGLGQLGSYHIYFIINAKVGFGCLSEGRGVT